ncbi:MAG TPA: hypothetical protein VGV91_03815 [Rubrobacter sp.]|nr:hypothetical protein [Rubrobacter sp.]
MAFGFIFFVARGCVATQESTQVRKYVTGADSVLSDSSNAGRNELQGILQSSGGDPGMVDEEALGRVATLSDRLYTQALQNDEIPPEFEDAQPYLISALGVRKEATENLAAAVGGSGNGFGDALATAVEDFRTSDSIIANHYVPAVRESLEQAGQTSDGGYLEDPQPFMDYSAIGFDAASTGSARSDPSAVHGVEIDGVTVAGQPLPPGGNVMLTGDDVATFAVTVANGGEVPESAVDVEVVLNTDAERQTKSATVARIEPKGTATVEIGGFIPGALDEVVETTVEAGPVKYEKTLENNTLNGSITFGL